MAPEDGAQGRAARVPAGLRGPRRCPGFSLRGPLLPSPQFPPQPQFPPSPQFLSYWQILLSLS